MGDGNGGGSPSAWDPGTAPPSTGTRLAFGQQVSGPREAVGLAAVPLTCQASVSSTCEMRPRHGGARPGPLPQHESHLSSQLPALTSRYSFSRPGRRHRAWLTENIQ